MKEKNGNIKNYFSNYNNYNLGGMSCFSRFNTGGEISFFVFLVYELDCGYADSILFNKKVKGGCYENV